MLAFLLCDSASTGTDGKVNLHGLFDRIVVPRDPVPRKIIFVFYKIEAEQPCTLCLRVLDPRGAEIPGPWRDSIEQPGLMQTVWSLATDLLGQAGAYALELWQESDDSKPVSLATMRLIVDQK